MTEIPQYLTLKRHRDLVGRGAHVWVSRGLLALIGCVLLAGLFNVFGQRPATSRAATNAAVLSVYSPDRVRGGLLYTARFHVTARRDLQKAVLTLDPGWIEGMQINSVTPQPVDESSRDGKIALDLGHIAAGHSAIYFLELQVDPTNVGRRSQDVSLDDGSTHILTIHRTITVYP
jgi:hypothetical protein